MGNFALVGGTAHSLINFRFDLLKELVKKYRKVYACAPSFTEQEIHQLQSIGVLTQTFKLDRNGINPLKDIKTIISLRKFFLQEKIDHVLFYTPKVVIYGSIAASLAGVAKIYSMITGLGYAFSVDSFKAKLVRFIQRNLYSFALKKNKKVIFQNPDDLKFFADLGLASEKQAERVHGSGVNLEHFKKSPLPEQVSFIMVARLIPEKGLLDYLEAARIVKESHPNIPFYLVGDFDRDAKQLKDKVMGDYISKKVVEYLGFQQDIREAVAKASVFVLPSYREGTPRSVLEAMALGRAIITTDAPGCRETVKKGANGFLVPCRDPQSLVAMMLKFINEPKLSSEMGHASREIATRVFDVNIINREMLAIFNA